MPASKNTDVLHIYNEDLYISIPSNEHFSLTKGQFEQKVLLICLHEDVNDASMLTLDKMMKSCKLEEKDYGLVVISSQNEALEVIQQFRPGIVILFGIVLQTQQLQINKTWYKPFHYNQIQFLQSDSLAKLNQNQELKVQLWNKGLKVLFKIN